jgi:hypothetical protein
MGCGVAGLRLAYYGRRCGTCGVLDSWIEGSPCLIFSTCASAGAWLNASCAGCADPAHKVVLLSHTPCLARWVVAGQEVVTVMRMGFRLRATHETKMNAVSSRSHTVFTINIIQKGAWRPTSVHALPLLPRTRTLLQRGVLRTVPTHTHAHTSPRGVCSAQYAHAHARCAVLI